MAREVGPRAVPEEEEPRRSTAIAEVLEILNQAIGGARIGWPSERGCIDRANLDATRGAFLVWEGGELVPVGIADASGRGFHWYRTRGKGRKKLEVINGY